MAESIGIQGQIWRNNRRSTLLLLAFPSLILGTVFGVIYFMYLSEVYPEPVNMDRVVDDFVRVIPFVLGGVGIWFLIAYLSHSSMIKAAVKSHTLDRKENPRVYNLVENLCMSKGMPMPKVNIIESDALNAFASGLDKRSYTVTLTRGIIEQLTDEELEGVIAHELMHIRNKDVRLLVISIIFVGIFAFVVQVAFRSLLYGGGRRDKKDDNRLMLIILLVSLVAYALSIMFRFALSRKREYLADAGAAEMTKNPQALASALRKVSGNHKVSHVKSDDLEQMFIQNEPDKVLGFISLGGMFSTHPPINNRIQLLEQF
jgi:heat shock protein HtpX